MVDGTGCLLTPGLVNTHQHLYQWATRGLAVDATLFEWLTALYPVWAGHRRGGGAAPPSARRSAGWPAPAARRAPTTTTCSRPAAATCSAPRSTRRPRSGLRFHPTRGSMDLGASQGGLPPDSVVEDLDAVLAATEAAITRFHDPSHDAMVRVAVAPCSPFSVTAKLMTEAADLARRHGVRLHTHLAETDDEEVVLPASGSAATPTEYVDSLGWLGDDVWMAHAVHLDDAAVARFAATGTGVAHCPSSNARLGAGIAPGPRPASTRACRSGSASTARRPTRPARCSRSCGTRALFARARGGPAALAAARGAAAGHHRRRPVPRP